MYYRANMAKDNKKLTELALHISKIANGDNYLGKTKLNKLLFLADFHYFFENGKSITDQTYLHLPNGHVPVGMMKIEKEKKDIVFLPSKIGTKIQERPTPLREADLSVFTAEEIAFVDEIVDYVCHKNNVTASSLSGQSHDYIGWLMTSNGEEIPYNTIYLENKAKQKTTDFDKFHVEKLLRELGGDYGFKQTA